MFTLYIAILCFVFAGINVIVGYKYNNNDFYGYAKTLLFIGTIIATSSLIITMGSYSNQLSNMEDIRKIDQLRIVYSNKSDNLTGQFAKYLADIYPDHEKDIFGKISPDDINIYLVKYPEIQAATTLTKLVDEINRLQTDIYDQDIRKQELLKTIRYRQINPWIYNSLIPKYVEAF